MATNRLAFLYPRLFRSGTRWADSAASPLVRRPRRSNPSSPSSPFPPSGCCRHAALFTTPSSTRQVAFAGRAGKGIEPLPPDPPASPSAKEGEAGRQESQARVQEALKDPPPRDRQWQQSPSSSSRPDLPKTIELPPPSSIDPVTQTTKGSPMDAILHMGPPPDSVQPPPPGVQASIAPRDSTADPNATSLRPKKRAPTPYVHHFDSYTLVKQLTEGGYSHGQAVTAMKAIRTLLAVHLKEAQGGLMSKSDMENETYLFRAACSELGAEVRNNRRAADEQLRQQRTLLQHEVDILTQRLNQELVNLNDSVRGMFNDRRMAVREEQKAVESRIQQINYKISVALNSDAKSNIEALRWVLIRRSALGILFMAILTLSTIRYTTYSARKRKDDEERARAAEKQRQEQLAPSVAAVGSEILGSTGS
ncbi:hypothetical protein VTJ83DRAFT_900 [Remersonia thermophila]|uniref:MOZ protein represents a chromatin-associated acetyltransferase n=1 Tax=Remersonia thermophila TaxID=72144 RepID=A0ABR4DPZ5_9PEZI